MLIGTTYSHTHISALGINQDTALEALFKLNLDIVRLGCYWNEIEQKKSNYDFSKMHRLLNICKKNKQSVVLTIGMKAPRWPEFYIPKWATLQNLQDITPQVLAFISQTVKEFKSYTCINYWQIENEPLDPSGPKNLSIALKTLREEISYVRQLDPTRKIIINLWGNALSKRKQISNVLPLTDILGLDLYYKQFIYKKFFVSLYKGPSDSDKKLKDIIHAIEKPVWFTELQAEPWEANDAGYKSENPKSMNAILLEKNFKRAKKLHPEAILFWGFEYWLWKKLQGDSRMWDTAERIIVEEKKSS